MTTTTPAQTAALDAVVAVHDDIDIVGHGNQIGRLIAAEKVMASVWGISRAKAHNIAYRQWQDTRPADEQWWDAE